jgi:hypothetical protein
MLPVAVGVALLLDCLIYLRNSPRNERKTFHPNLRLWGLGLIAGIASVVTSFFAQALQNLQPTGTTWLSLAPLFFLTPAVGFILWAIVGLCKSE